MSALESDPGMKDIAVGVLIMAELGVLTCLQ
jgi:hypothetical protein